jgi:uncharacterized Ntn-hydrolase superfamily protein
VKPDAPFQNHAFARHAFLVAMLVFAFPAAASATWSIVVADSKTGEVGIGSATCIDNFNLKDAVGVIVVGKGAGQAQAMVDPGQNRLTIANGLLAGLSAQQILDQLEQTDPIFEQHQYGIAELMGGAATFTGIWNGDHASGVTGQVGSLVYAIQGNVLTGDLVILEAEQALIHTEGDLGQKIMAAMHGAKIFGGDGRCSCANGQATTCGCPPTLQGGTEPGHPLPLSRSRGGAA